MKVIAITKKEYTFGNVKENGKLFDNTHSGLTFAGLPCRHSLVGDTDGIA